MFVYIYVRLYLRACESMPTPMSLSPLQLFYGDAFVYVYVCVGPCVRVRVCVQT